MLDRLSASYEWILILFFTFNVIEHEYGGMLSALAFLSGSVNRILFVKIIAKQLQNFTEKYKLYISLMIRIVIIILFLFIPKISFNIYYLLTCIYIVNLAMLVDGYAIFNIKYQYDKDNLISLNRYASLFNLGKRGSVAIGSLLAVYLSNWESLSYCLSIFGLLGVMAIIINLIIFKKYSKDHKENSNETLFSTNLLNSAVRFASTYLFSMNLFFGSLALLLSRAVTQYDLSTSTGFSILTTFYIGFISFNIIAIFSDKKIQVFYTPKNIIFCAYLLAISILSMSFRINDFYYVVFLSIFGGLFYGFTLLGFSVVTLKLIKGKVAPVLFSKIDTYGRIGFFISFFIMGLLTDLNIETYQLFTLIGISGVIGMFFTNKMSNTKELNFEIKTHNL